MWNKNHSNTLQCIFSALDNKKIRWMVLRNYGGLPEKNRSKDVDLIFLKHELPIAKDALFQSIRESQYSHFSETIFQSIWCYSFFQTNGDEIYTIKIDLLNGFVWRGAEVISFQNLFNNRVTYKRFYVPNQTYDAFDLWIKPLMTGGFIKKKYRTDILRVLETQLLGKI